MKKETIERIALLGGIIGHKAGGLCFCLIFAREFYQVKRENSRKIISLV